MYKLQNKINFLNLLCLITIFLLVKINESQGQSSPCLSKFTCSDCIRTKNCTWCMKSSNDDLPYCFESSLQSANERCPEENIMNSNNEEKIILSNNLTRAKQNVVRDSAGYNGDSYENLNSTSFSQNSSEFDSSYSSKIVQIKPQRISLKMGVNKVHKIQFQYSKAEDYPVDLYYLMDLSKSMHHDKEKLLLLGDLLAQTIGNITSNFRLGFGSFIFHNGPECKNCEAPYDFKNHMALSKDARKFSQKIRRPSLSGNISVLEGGFDAIMQAIECRQQIGWRKEARRFLVFSTNAGFYDKREIGGFIRPNDGHCHLIKDTYFHSHSFDYPTISQINEKVKENAVKIIFAVTPEQHHVYRNLSFQIEGSLSGILAKDSSNVVELIKSEYNKITSVIEIKDNATKPVQVKYYSTCLGSSEIETNKCYGLKVDDLITFSAEIEVTSCPKNPDKWNEIIQLYPVGINEALTIDLQMLCSCESEHSKREIFEYNSPKCNYHGNYNSGICECQNKYYGKTCECSIEQVEQSCRPDNITQLDCSGRGLCDCGKCICIKRYNPDEIIFGKFCECDNFSCARYNNKICSGSDHGICECGICKCMPGWSGNACECKTTSETCISSGSAEVCSGHGICVCGECKCEVTDKGRYSGRFCEQ